MPESFPRDRPHRRTSAALRARPAVLSVLAAVALATGALAAPAAAAPPDAAVLVAPADGSTASTSTPQLSALLTDPDGGDVPYRLEGRRLGATAPGQGSGDPFTIAVLPDTQNYTYLNRQGTIAQQAQWAVDTRAQLNTAMVVQLGDLVSNYGDVTQWGHVSAGLRILDDARMPNTVVPGNHDFDNATGAIGLYGSYFPPSRYAGASWLPANARYGGYLGQNQFGADPVDRQNMDNYALFSAGGRDFLVLNLEWEAPASALAWADRVLAAHPDRIVILTTHSFVSITGGRRTTAERPGGTPPAVLWSDFVATHCQVRLVLSGHEHDGDNGEQNRTDANSCGQPVHQILTDYQDRANGGDGWLRYYTFDPVAGTMRATTYSPKLGLTESDANSAFTLPFPLGATGPAPFTEIASGAVPSGGVASAAWTGLAADTSYEWRVVSGSGAETTASAVWTVRTPARAEVVSDTFTRTVSGGWGAADTGQSWVPTASPASFSVDGSRARMALPVGGGRSARLPDASLRDTAISTEVAVTPTPTGSGTYVSLMARSSGVNSYRAKLQFATGGAVTLLITRFTGPEVNLAYLKLPGSYATGTPIAARFEVTGASPTLLRAKAWRASDAEPAAWTVTASDATAGLQGAGVTGIDGYLSSGATSPAVIAVDRVVVTAPGGTPPPANLPPTAVIGAPVINERTVTLSGTGSTDSDGTIASYAWSLGDGSTATGPTTSRSYAADGTYTVTLTVTDDDGATHTTTRTVTVAATPPPANLPPTAVIGAPVISERTVTLSGTGSTDSDGTIASYAWSLGDGSTATGPTTTRSYAADGTYTVTLTVTDDDGATHTTTRTVTVAATPPPVAGLLVSDDFERTVANGWGSATTGGAWTTAGTATRFAVAGGTGQHRLTAAGSSADTLATGQRALAAELRADVAFSRTAASGTLYTSLIPRAISTTTEYRLRVMVAANGRPQLILVRMVNGVETNLSSVVLANVTVTAGTYYSVAVRAVPNAAGTATVLSGKLWMRGTTEPTSWQLTATDATAVLQAPGYAKLNSYESGSATQPVTTFFDALRFSSIGG